MNVDPMYLENLDEFINDEKRIVTYRWLSLTLNVSSNIAKQMLYHYYDHHKDASEGKGDFSVTYLLTGIEHDVHLNQDIHKVCVVRDKDLEATKSRFKEVFSLHIYSLQKDQLKDLHHLYGNDYDKIRENISQSTRHSAITCPTVSIHSSKEVTKPEKEAVGGEKESHFTKFEGTTQEEEDGAENKENKANVENTRARPVSKSSKGAIASMFASQATKLESKNGLQTKSTVNSKTGSKTMQTKPSSSMGAPKKGLLASFFTKVPGPNKPLKVEEKVAITDDPRSNATEDTSSSESSRQKTAVTPSQDSKEANKEDKRKNTKPRPKPGSKAKRKSSAPPSNANTKRRRILTLDSSSESSGDEEEEALMDECPLPSSPPTRGGAIQSDDEDDVIPQTPEDPARTDDGSKFRKRQKKQVDKTYMDEDGYLVTKKEYEFVSESDEEDPIPSSVGKKTPSKVEETSPSKKEVGSPIKEVKRSPVKTKQASIMSFFKKK